MPKFMEYLQGAGEDRIKVNHTLIMYSVLFSYLPTLDPLDTYV